MGDDIQVVYDKWYICEAIPLVKSVGGTLVPDGVDVWGNIAAGPFDSEEEARKYKSSHPEVQGINYSVLFRGR